MAETGRGEVQNYEGADGLNWKLRTLGRGCLKPSPGKSPGPVVKGKGAPHGGTRAHSLQEIIPELLTAPGEGKRGGAGKGTEGRGERGGTAGQLSAI